MKRNKESNILFFSGSSKMGGAENSLLDLINYSVNLNTGKIWVALPESNGNLQSIIESKFGTNVQTVIFEYPGELKASGRHSNIVNLLKGIKSLSEYSKNVSEFMHKNNISCFYANGLKPFLVGCSLKRILKNQNYNFTLVWHLRDWLKGNKRLLFSLLGNFYADHIIANSKATSDQILFRDCAGNEPSKILNPIDTEKFKPMSMELSRKNAGIPLKGNHVAMFGMLTPWKGQEVFIRAASEVETEDTNFYIIGGEIYSTDGHSKEKERLSKIADSLGLKSRLKFLGHIPEPEKIYSAFNLAVHASIEPEPFGRIIAEAMACEVPVIASDAGGAKELKNNNGYPLYFTPGNYKELSKLIDSVLSDEAKSFKAKASRNWIEKNISIQAMGTEMDKVIKTAIAA